MRLLVAIDGSKFAEAAIQAVLSQGPGKWLLLSSAADIVVVGILASRGILMQAITPKILFGVLISCAFYLAAVDFVKIGLLRKLPQGL